MSHAYRKVVWSFCAPGTSLFIVASAGTTSERTKRMRTPSVFSRRAESRRFGLAPPSPDPRVYAAHVRELRPGWEVWIDRALACVFAAAAAHHLVAALRGSAIDGSSPLRHAVFVGINLLVALGFLARTRRLRAVVAVFFGVLVVQQMGSHGGAALRALREGAPFLADGAIAVGLLLLFVWVLLRAWRAPVEA